MTVILPATGHLSRGPPLQIADLWTSRHYMEWSEVISVQVERLALKNCAQRAHEPDSARWHNARLHSGEGPQHWTLR